ncbi:hypothetical protein AB0N97_37830 [Streptomyces collinus]
MLVVWLLGFVLRSADTGGRKGHLDGWTRQQMSRQVAYGSSPVI